MGQHTATIETFVVADQDLPVYYARMLQAQEVGMRHRSCKPFCGMGSELQTEQQTLCLISAICGTTY